MTSRRARAALAVLVALLLAGCGGLSHDGPVEPGLDLGSGNPPNLGVSPPARWTVPARRASCAAS